MGAAFLHLDDQAIANDVLKAIRRWSRGCTCILLLRKSIRTVRQHFVLQYLYISVTKSFSFLRVGHNLIVSHASVVKLYRDEFKAIQGGQIGITLNGDWQMPYDDKSESKKPIIFSFSWQLPTFL